MDLADKHVWITGAAGSLGRALVRAALDRGARVTATDLDRDACDAIARQGRVVSVPCDLTDAPAVAAAHAALTARSGPVDVLVNNAGITHFSSLRDTPLAVYEKVMRVNLFGALACTKLCVDDVERRAGAIVAVSSAAGFGPLADRTGYAASKHAMNGLFTSLGTELSRARVYVVCPSFIRDDAGEKAPAAADGTARPGADAARNHGRGMTADEAARDIWAVLGRPSGVYPVGRVGWLAYGLQRVSPRLYARAMLRGMGRRQT